MLTSCALLKRPLIVAGAAVLLLINQGNAQQASQNNKYAGYATRVIEQYILPKSAAFQNDINKLAAAAKAHCTAPDAKSTAAYNGAFRNAVRGLAHVDILRFGPLTQNSLAQRLAFLPDKRGATQRQLNKVLAKQDPSVTSADSLAHKSVALQGLVALEKLSYDTKGALRLGTSDAAGAFSCQFAIAITQRLQQSADELLRGWQDLQGYRAVLEAPSAANSEIKTHHEATEKIYNALVTALIFDKDQIVLAVLGKSAKKAAPHKAPFARSGNAIAYLQASLEGTEQALTAGEFTASLSGTEIWVKDSLAFEFANAQRTLSKIPQPLRDSGRSAEVRKQLTYLDIVIGSLRSTLAEDLAGYLGLAGGFNSLDGD
ncbi:imelysin family protein [Polycladidibacter hongkongensis]|uniref:imelysin family protein n=1 Tax=Polycladidibacter hongkongensis TaxID=1647556 RepID=UPI00083740C6|nr:imelysin family protein [Pseudovibrio hongkongensis]